jgi:hypothetical protein
MARCRKKKKSGGCRERRCSLGFLALAFSTVPFSFSKRRTPPSRGPRRSSSPPCPAPPPPPLPEMASEPPPGSTGGEQRTPPEPSAPAAPRVSYEQRCVSILYPSIAQSPKPCHFSDARSLRGPVGSRVSFALGRARGLVAGEGGARGGQGPRRRDPPRPADEACPPPAAPFFDSVGQLPPKFALSAHPVGGKRDFRLLLRH